MLLKPMQALEFWDCCNMEQLVIAFMIDRFNPLTSV